MSRFPEHRPFVLAFLLLAGFASARKAPVALSWRSMGMGGAGVAVVDDADAVHLNPAGLAQLGWQGSFRPLDTLGYKRNKVDLRGSFELDPDVEGLLELKSFFDKYGGTIDSAAKGDPLVLYGNQQLVDDLYQFDRKPMVSSVSTDAAAAFHGIGFGFWTRNEATLLIDHGALTPKAQLGAQSTMAIEMATAQSFLKDRLSLGVGYRIAAISGDKAEYDLIELDSLGLSAGEKLLWKTEKGLYKTGDWGHGLDLGILWFQTPGLRFGGSLRDLGMKVGGQAVCPNLSLGLAWAPAALQSNGLMWRRINLGFALDDLLWDTLQYKPLSKIDFGAEFQGQLIPKVFSAGFAGGFHGGYPTAMVTFQAFQLLRMDLLTYAQEVGWYTSDREDRRWAVRFSGQI